MKVTQTRCIFLADDDDDDCLFFKEAMDELPVTNALTTVHNGEQLMKLLKTVDELPLLLFLDLNMPRKNGFQCLQEIKQDEQLKQLNVVIVSTSFQQDVADLLYNTGAQYFIHKPAAFGDLKRVIHKVIMIMEQTLLVSASEQAGRISQPARENFVIV
jgi:CheY-like chemotaxis protein